MAGSPRPLPVPEIGARLRARFGEDVRSVEEQHGHAVATLSPSVYHDAIRFCRDDADIACDYCDFVTVVDHREAGMEIVVHLASTVARHGVRIKVMVSAEGPSIPTISDLYPTANWHERECMEMFGIEVIGHPEPVKLLLPEPFEGHPMRKDFALMSRVAKPWPGAAEGEEDEEE